MSIPLQLRTSDKDKYTYPDNMAQWGGGEFTFTGAPHLRYLIFHVNRLGIHAGVKVVAERDDGRKEGFSA